MTLHDQERIQQRLSSVADPIGFLINLFSHAPVGFAVWTADGHPLLTNKAFLELFGVEPPPEYNVLKDELLAANGMLSLFERAFRGETVDVPTFWYDPREHTSISVTGGRRVAISMTIFPLFKVNGEIDYVAATYKDETELMLGTERLRQNEQRQRLAEQSSRIASFEWNLETEVNAWTPELEALYGLSPGEFAATQTSWEQLIYPEDRTHAMAAVERALATFAPAEDEWRVVWKDGTVHWIFGRFQVLRDVHGKPHRLIGVNIDITERRRNEEARLSAEATLKRSEEDLRITLDSIGDAVIATDAKGRVRRMNPVAEDLTGWTFAEASGKPLGEVFRIVDEDTREIVESPVERVVREGTVVERMNHAALISRNGSERAIANSGAPIRDSAGSLRGVVLVFHDQSAQRNAEREAARAAARLRVLTETSHQFSATTDLHALFDLIVERVGHVLGETCVIHLIVQGREEMETVAIYHPDEEILAAVRRIVMSHPVRIGDGLSGKVAATGEPALVSGRSGEEAPAGVSRDEHRPVVQWLSVSSALAVPLKSSERVIGVLSLLRSKRSEPFTRDDQRLAEELAARAAQAIENARLLAELGERVSALRRSEYRFRRLSDAGIVGIINCDLYGNILDANDTFLRMVGYSGEEVLSGQVRWRDMTPPEWRHLDERAIEQLKATGVADPWEKEYIRKDGSRIPILVGVAILDQAQGLAIAFVLELTERKRAEAAVRESEARRAAVMEAALDAIVLMDHHEKIVDFNPAAERIFGYPREEVIGQPMAAVLGLERYRHSGVAPIVGQRIEVPARRKDGSEFPAEVAVVQIRSEGPPVFTGYVRDVTERRQAAEAEVLRRAKEAAEEANAELEAFSYSVAHDLRAPLRSINGFSTALQEDWGDKLDAESRGNLGRIMSGADRMARLIDALLGLARLTRTEPKGEAVDLSQIAKSVIAQLQSSDPERRVECLITENLVVQGDPQLLRALLENLLGNAWKFTNKRSEARIELGREEHEGSPIYFVRDNGAGFEMEYVRKLFAPFRRLHSQKDYEGMGIGLANVQRIVRRHGGQIWAEGAIDRGATFRFTLSSNGRDGGGQPWARGR